jgi:hypothetical protein
MASQLRQVLGKLFSKDLQDIKILAHHETPQREEEAIEWNSYIRQGSHGDESIPVLALSFT